VSRNTYDVIIVDAYCPPYIPFQLTTREFFALAYERLSPDGVVAINVARTETDYTLVDAIAGTMKAVYPSVYVLDTLSNLNSVVIATRQPSELSAIQTELARVSDPVLRDVVQRATGRIREFTASSQRILCDDHAPVEQILHTMMARYILGQPTREVLP